MIVMAIQGIVARLIIVSCVATFYVCSTSKSSPCGSDFVWEGRVSFQNYGSDCVAIYDWNAVTFYTKVAIESVGDFAAELDSGGKSMWLPFGKRQFNFVNRWLVKVLDVETNKVIQETKIELAPHDRRVNVTIANLTKPGNYVISCRKINQPNLVIGTPLIQPGPIRIHSFRATGGVNFVAGASSLRSLLFPHSKKIEVWGASDTSGFGTDLKGSPASNKQFCENEAAEITNVYQNADLAYGSLVARHFGAELHLQAVAGIGNQRNAKWTDWWFKTFIKWLSVTGVISYMQPMPHYFGNTLGTSAADAQDWNFASWKPDLILLMLGGNDKVCDTSTGGVNMPVDFVDVYVKTIAKVFEKFEPLNHAPVVVSVCGFSSSSEAGTCNRNSACQEISKGASKFNESFGHWKNMNHFVEVPLGVVPNTAIHGCGGHRTAEGQQAVANYLIPVLRSIMNWQEIESTLSINI